MTKKRKGARRHRPTPFEAAPASVQAAPAVPSALKDKVTSDLKAAVAQQVKELKDVQQWSTDLSERLRYFEERTSVLERHNVQLSNCLQRMRAEVERVEVLLGGYERLTTCLKFHREEGAKEVAAQELELAHAVLALQDLSITRRRPRLLSDEDLRQQLTEQLTA